MIKNKQTLIAEELPEFQASIDSMPADSRIFVDKSLEIANYIMQLMELKDMRQKDLAEKLSKSEAEISKILSGMQNLTIRTLAKLEAVLEETIVCTPNIDLSIDIEKNYGSAKHFRATAQKEEQYSMEYGSSCKVIKMSFNNKGLQTKAGAI